MSLRDILSADLRKAMRSRDQVLLGALRQIKSTVDTEESREGIEFDDAAIEVIISRLVRQHRESIEIFSQQGRADLVTKEESELGALLSYLPKQLSQVEIRTMVEEIAAKVGASGPHDKGKVMGQLMPQVKGRAEGKVVNDLVTEVLAAL